MANKSQNVVHEQALKELVQIVHGLSFDTAYGVSKRGRYVHVTADPQWSDSEGAFSVLITCFPIGHQVMAVQALPIIIQSTDGSSCAYVARLDQRGQTIIPRLPAGAYRCQVSALWCYSPSPVVGHAEGIGQIPETLAASDDEQEEQVLVVPDTYTSNDKRVSVTPSQLESGRTALDFETAHRDLSNYIVRFAFVYPSGEVLYTGEGILQQEDSRPLWVMHWEGQVSDEGECELLFQVFPPDVKSVSQ